MISLQEKKDEFCSDVNLEDLVEEVVEHTVEKVVSNEKRLKIMWNHNYLTISLYAIFTLVSSILILYFFINFDKTKNIVLFFLKAISPFIAGLFIAFLIDPLIKRINKYQLKIFKIKSKKIRMMISMLLSYIIVIGAIVLTLVYVTPELIDSITDLVAQQTEMTDRIYKYIMSLYEKYPDIDFDIIYSFMETKIPDIIKHSTQLLSNMIPKLYMFSVSIIKTFVNLLLSLVISLYIILDKKHLKFNIKRIIYALVSKENANGILKVSRESADIFNKFFVGKFIDSLIIGVLCYLLMLMLKLPYAVLLSIIVGITNMIPYFGPFIGAIPGVILYLLIDPVKAIIFAIMIFALQQFDGLYLGPKILGDSIGLKPLWIIFSITIGGVYAGVLGMLFAVPIFAVITFIFDKVITKRLSKKNIVVDKR